MFSMKRARARTAKATKFFLDEYARKGKSISDARAAIQRKFHLSDSSWYSLKRKLARLPQVVGISGEISRNLPAPLAHGCASLDVASLPCSPEVMATVNQLLAINGQQEVRIQGQYVENATLKTNAQELSARIALLKKVNTALMSVL